MHDMRSTPPPPPERVACCAQFAFPCTLLRRWIPVCVAFMNNDIWLDSYTW